MLPTLRAIFSRDTYPMYTYPAFLCLIALCLIAETYQIWVLAATPSLPPNFSVKALGTVSQGKNFPDVKRDGGGGGLVNGKHLLVFSDTATVDGDGRQYGFTCNSVAYSDSKHPLQLTDFGTNGVPDLGVPWLHNESVLADKLYEKDHDQRLIIWPTSSIATLPGGKSGVSVYEVVRIPSGEILYSTMVQYNSTSKGPGAHRLAPVLFQSKETPYGTFSTATSAKDDYIFLFATVDQAKAINVARAPAAHPADKSKYTYWTGKSWSKNPPSQTSGHIATDPRTFSYGDFSWNKHLKTWLLIYFVAELDSTFHLQYSTTSRAEGPYSDPIKLFTTVPVKGGFNYQGHAYSGYDETGKTMMLSWTYNDVTTKMAKVTFH